MKKVSIITLHRVFNYGSVLQAYATQEILKKHGMETEIIDYIPKSWQTKHMIFHIQKSNGFVKDTLYRLLRVGSIFLKQQTFWKFLRRNLSMTKPYKSYEQLCKNPPEADIYCTGSDQVWNSGYCNMDKAFFLQFGDKNIKRIAYAASIGNTELEPEEEKIISPYIKDYSALSVREESAVDILKKMGYASVCITDPTLQLEKEEWLKLASGRLIKDKYLLLMLLYNEDNNATEIARKIADKKGLKLVKLSWEMKKPEMVDILMTHRPVEDFISLIYHADFVVTNSFHALVFSINLNKQFLAIKRNEYNSRLESILRITSLEDRLTGTQFDEAVTEKTIDFEPVNKILDTERKKAYTFLEEALNG
ncbi:MAG: polysaccharide pyruvyl transferase family protein [Ruminococcaceae bacterium]|nr:polysaccharide pyruvyl transferase family protein [Oscillospiraceae bacterium]